MRYDFLDGIEIRFIHNSDLVTTLEQEQESQDAVSDFMSDITAHALVLMRAPEYRDLFDKYEIDFTTAYVYE